MDKFTKKFKKIFHDTQKEIKKNNKIKLMEPTYGVEEILAANEVLISTNVTMGKRLKNLKIPMLKNINLNMQ